MFGRENYSDYNGAHNDFANATASARDETINVATETMFKSMLNGLNFMKRDAENTALSKILKEGNNINW